MLQYKAGYKFVNGGVHVQVFDFPEAMPADRVSFGRWPTLDCPGRARPGKRGQVHFSSLFNALSFRRPIRAVV